MAVYGLLVSCSLYCAFSTTREVESAAKRGSNGLAGERGTDSICRPAKRARKRPKEKEHHLGLERGYSLGLLRLVYIYVCGCKLAAEKGTILIICLYS